MSFGKKAFVVTSLAATALLFSAVLLCIATGDVSSLLVSSHEVGLPERSGNDTNYEGDDTDLLDGYTAVLVTYKRLALIEKVVKNLRGASRLRAVVVVRFARPFAPNISHNPAGVESKSSESYQ